MPFHRRTKRSLKLAEYDPKETPCCLLKKYGLFSSTRIFTLMIRDIYKWLLSLIAGMLLPMMRIITLPDKTAREEIRRLGEMLKC